MKPERVLQLAEDYARLHIAVIGDFCLDRYLDIDPRLAEVSIETGREVYNVIQVRAQPGGAGTVLNNLVALGVGTVTPIGVAGDDGEGYELARALGKMPGVRAESFLRCEQRRTFTYCKPMLRVEGGPAVELNRLDSKNWTPMPADLEVQLLGHVKTVAETADAVVLLDQVDRAETGTITPAVRDAAALAAGRRGIPVIADCRRGLAGYPPVIFKMNAAELSRFRGVSPNDDLGHIGALAGQVAARNGRPVFVTLAERGILAAAADGTVHHAPALPVRGPIDVVGAGDCVTANLIAALAAGASLPEALAIAVHAASLVIHQLGTTGVANLEQIAALMRNPAMNPCNGCR
jgi:rfaE bifunctional protein kinase chain/domain